MDVGTLLARARSALDQKVAYRPGEGGFHQDAPGPARNGRCDCSSFVCWALGFSRITRHPKKGSGRRYGHIGLVTRVAGGSPSTTISAWYEGIER